MTEDERKNLSRRRRAARKYLPSRVELLLVAEAPPCDTDRYFYFEEVDRHDWLYRYVWEGLTGCKPIRGEKASHLAAMRDAGVFLIDLHEGNIAKPKRKDLEPCVGGLVRRSKKLEPGCVVLIKKVVHEVAYEPLREVGLDVMDVAIPFPASGQQKNFLALFREAVRLSGFEMARVARS
ncbi:MAG: hypothetical protein ACYTF7_11470 [Planctomycetota bacterium]|jgi:hypothetical protein